MNKPFSPSCLLLPAAAAALLLPSCIRWNIGENILTAREAHVALDHRQPVDGKVYRVVRPKGRVHYFARLPEVRYHVMPAVVKFDMYDLKGYAVRGAEPTGREEVVEVEMQTVYREGRERLRTPLRIASRCGMRTYHSLPSDAVALPCEPDEADVPSLPHAEREPESAPGGLRRAVAGAFSYTLDPLLTFACTSAYWAVSIPLEFATMPFCFLLHQQPAESEEARRPIPPPVGEEEVPYEVVDMSAQP